LLGWIGRLNGRTIMWTSAPSWPVNASCGRYLMPPVKPVRGDSRDPIASELHDVSSCYPNEQGSERRSTSTIEKRCVSRCESRRNPDTGDAKHGAPCRGTNRSKDAFFHMVSICERKYDPSSRAYPTGRLCVLKSLSKASADVAYALWIIGPTSGMSSIYPTRSNSQQSGVTCRVAEMAEAV
jgi:hypothetical protein